MVLSLLYEAGFSLKVDHFFLCAHKDLFIYISYVIVNWDLMLLQTPIYCRNTNSLFQSIHKTGNALYRQIISLRFLGKPFNSKRLQH